MWVQPAGHQVRGRRGLGLRDQHATCLGGGGGWLCVDGACEWQLSAKAAAQGGCVSKHALPPFPSAGPAGPGLGQPWQHERGAGPALHAHRHGQQRGRRCGQWRRRCGCSSCGHAGGCQRWRACAVRERGQSSAVQVVLSPLIPCTWCRALWLLRPRLPRSRCSRRAASSCCCRSSSIMDRLMRGNSSGSQGSPGSGSLGPSAGTSAGGASPRATAGAGGSRFGRTTGESCDRPPVSAAAPAVRSRPARAAADDTVPLGLSAGDADAEAGLRPMPVAPGTPPAGVQPPPTPGRPASDPSLTAGDPGLRDVSLGAFPAAAAAADQAAGSGQLTPREAAGGVGSAGHSPAGAEVGHGGLWAWVWVGGGGSGWQALLLAG